MDFSKLFIAAVVGVGLGILPDWFFGGVLFHDKYKAYPEVWWRPQGGPGENRAIALAVVLSLLTYFGFACLYVASGIHGLFAGLSVAGAVWLAVPVPLLITNALFVKTHPAIVFSHSLGWLAKLCVAAIASAWILK